MLEGGLMPGRDDRVKETLSGLKAHGIESCAVIRRDGIMVESEMMIADEEKEIFAAMTAAMLGAAETVTSELRQGIPRRVILEIGGKKLVAVGAGPMVLLAAVIGAKAQHGTALSEIEKAASEVKVLMRQKK